jgi:hypothetical protein
MYVQMFGRWMLAVLLLLGMSAHTSSSSSPSSPYAEWPLLPAHFPSIPSFPSSPSLAFDESVRWLTLPNGALLALMRNVEPPGLLSCSLFASKVKLVDSLRFDIGSLGKVSLRLFVRAGSLQEETEEQGLVT